LDNLNGILSLLFACIELILVINILIFAKKNPNKFLASAIITLLFGYQLLEFLMCQAGLAYPSFAYAAFFVISFLPPVSLIFVLRFFNYNYKPALLFFLPALAFIVYYSTVLDHFEVVSCTVLYAAYNYPLGDLYGFFYYLPVVLSMIILFREIQKSQVKFKIKTTKILFTGHLFMALPVIAAFLLAELNAAEMLSAIESIMCKFALVYALCITYVIIFTEQDRT
jgi:hypothetical protein